jgi:hypothetical protein
MDIIKPPNKIRIYENEPSVFLAGSIEMGVARHWQDEFTAELQILFPDEGVILNPRRVEWDSSWEQKEDNPKFAEQVNWELDALDRCGHIVMYFDPNTKSPISLLELGLYASSGKLLVCCPEGFWRKGNVDIVCTRYNIPKVSSLKEAAIYIATRTYPHIYA